MFRAKGRFRILLAFRILHTPAAACSKRVDILHRMPEPWDRIGEDGAMQGASRQAQESRGDLGDHLHQAFWREAPRKEFQERKRKS